MGQEINLLDRYPWSSRPIEARGAAITEAHILIARQFGRDYFDGDRLYGYGGYGYHPRFWTETVRRFRDHYGLTEDARILDVGCAKGFMMHDFQALMPGATVLGLDISAYALDHAIEDMRGRMVRGNARDLPFADGAFDLVISINTVHNLARNECRHALSEIQRVTRGHAFVMVDAWHDQRERENMWKWRLGALTTLQVDEWRALFAEAGYEGDYYWFIAT